MPRHPADSMSVDSMFANPVFHYGGKAVGGRAYDPP
jgi:hypothetical protein